MHGRAYAAILAAVGILAGCVTEAPSEAAPAATAPDADRAETRGLAAFAETNRTESGLGGMEHRHDYWLGRDRVELFRERYGIAPWVFAPPARNIFLPEGQLVYEGTATLEFRVENPERHVCSPVLYLNGPVCSDSNGLGAPAGPGVPDPNPPRLRLEYMHAATSEWIDAGPLVWGQPLLLTTAPKEADMPHATVSLWRFRVWADTDVLAKTLSFEASATIVRGADVALWPGHPDFYADDPNRLVHEGDARIKEPGVRWFVESDSDYNYTEVTPQRLISWGTRTLHVWVNVSRAGSPAAGDFSDWWLGYVDAARRYREARPLVPPEDPAAPGDLYFVLPVGDEGMDSPYASESRWRFALWAYSEPSADGLPRTYLYGVVPYEVEYHIRIVASSLVAERYSEPGW